MFFLFFFKLKIKPLFLWNWLLKKYINSLNKLFCHEIDLNRTFFHIVFKTAIKKTILVCSIIFNKIIILCKYAVFVVKTKWVLYDFSLLYLKEIGNVIWFSARMPLICLFGTPSNFRLWKEKKNVVNNCGQSFKIYIYVLYSQYIIRSIIVGE